MSRRRTNYHGSGLASHSYENDCPRCGEDIEDWGDATKVKGRWIHKHCAGGGDEGAVQARYALTVAALLMVIVPVLAAITHLLGQPPP